MNCYRYQTVFAVALWFGILATTTYCEDAVKPPRPPEDFTATPTQVVPEPEPRAQKITNKNSILNLLKASFERTSFKDPEKWELGPGKDKTTYVEMKNQRPAAPDSTRVREAMQPVKEVHRTRIARLTMKKSDPNDALERWETRLAEIIPKDELEPARKAMRNAEVAWLDNPSLTFEEEAIGTRMKTRIKLSRSAVSLELLWINPKEPEALEAIAEQE